MGVPDWVTPSLLLEVGVVLVALVGYAIRQEMHNRRAQTEMRDLFKSHIAQEKQGLDTIAEALKELRTGQIELSNLSKQTARLQKETMDVLAQMRKDHLEAEKRNLVAHTELLTLVRGTSPAA